MLQESGAQKKMPSNKELLVPGVGEVSGLDLVFRDLLVFVAGPDQGVKLLKLGGSRSRDGLVPAGHVLQLTVGVLSVPGFCLSPLDWSSLTFRDL